MNRAWIDVEQGRRQLDWLVGFGDLDEADFLTAAGRQVGVRAANELEQFFGPGWLHKATQTIAPAQKPDLTRYWPSLRKAPAFVAALALWASLQLLTVDRVAGVGKLRANLRDNPVRDEFLHGIGQARLAVQARLAGARVVLEPRKPQGGPGDLLAVRAGSEVFIEFRRIGLDSASTKHHVRTEQMTCYLIHLEQKHSVRWSGVLLLNLGDDWQRIVEDAAVRAARDDRSIELTIDGDTLRVEPDAASVHTTLASPALEVDQQERLVRALMKKAVQTQSAGAAWIWLEDDGALWPMTAFARYPLTQKIRVLADTLGPLFTEHPHVLGVVVTSTEHRMDGPVDPDSEATEQGAGYLRTLPDGTVRESVVIPRNLVVPEQYALVRQLCADEPSWLDGALPRLGVPGGVNSLLSSQKSTGVETRRSPGGLYLPG
ncbi:hypothetical protein ACWEIJ_43955 [Lentzea sp. NPDC004789]